MVKFKQIIQWQSYSSPPMILGDRAITLQSRVMSIRLPFGGFVWNRPAGIVVEHKGQVEQLPIQDVTRSALLALALSTIAIALSARLLKLRTSGPAH